MKKTLIWMTLLAAALGGGAGVVIAQEAAVVAEPQGAGIILENISTYGK